MDSSKLYDEVREHYSSASRSTSVKYGETVAKSFGYSAEELANIPQDANLGLSCGNPLAIASLKEGDTVIDLGSGAGFDVFLAAAKVGPSGRAIGIDMNDDMLARANAIRATQSASGIPTDHITFLQGNITSLPFLASDMADCIISNCVINLVPRPDKPAVFREMYRLLKPRGGRVAVSDILAKKPLSEQLSKDMALYVGCIAGASTVAEYEAWLAEAGFTDVMIVDTGADLNVYLQTGEDGEKKSSSCSPAAAGGCGDAGVAAAPAGDGCSASAGLVPEKMDLNEFVGSYKIIAVKN
ncbi:S-adenosyl-L-methionine-dependent methyltransferase [Achaetomium macrosporum]|uniref:Arsenite methyltransferase n=1 Tax=Achaetomium macrosporum TaxID=79813 RepID=A0AAN7C9G1_9PEZI|nr:S-adenosyl-L-methionine-dependent methyltransferase [Achaetomium macrosporum]